MYSPFSRSECPSELFSSRGLFLRVVCKFEKFWCGSPQKTNTFEEKISLQKHSLFDLSTVLDHLPTMLPRRHLYVWFVFMALAMFTCISVLYWAISAQAVQTDQLHTSRRDSAVCSAFICVSYILLRSITHCLTIFYVMVL